MAGPTFRQLLDDATRRSREADENWSRDPIDTGTSSNPRSIRKSTAERVAEIERREAEKLAKQAERERAERERIAEEERRAATPWGTW